MQIKVNFGNADEWIINKHLLSFGIGRVYSLFARLSQMRLQNKKQTLYGNWEKEFLIEMHLL